MTCAAGKREMRILASRSAESRKRLHGERARTVMEDMWPSSDEGGCGGERMWRVPKASDTRRVVGEG